MATIQFLGSGSPTEAFNINHTLVDRPLLPGELRLRSPFPYPTLDLWRRTALQKTAVVPTTGNSDLATRGRTTVLFAHEADLSSIFFDIAGTSEELITGYYVDKQKAQLVDKALVIALSQLNSALAELKTQAIPSQYIELLQARVEGPSFNHRVAGMCAAVYLTSLLLEEENK